MDWQRNGGNQNRLKAGLHYEEPDTLKREQRTLLEVAEAAEEFELLDLDEGVEDLELLGLQLLLVGDAGLLDAPGGGDGAGIGGLFGGDGVTGGLLAGEVGGVGACFGFDDLEALEVVGLLAGFGFGGGGFFLSQAGAFFGEGYFFVGGGDAKLCA